MKSSDVERSWPAHLLQPVLDSLAQPHGSGFFIFGHPGQGKTTFLNDLRNALWAPGGSLTSNSPALRWSRLKLGDRRYLLCSPALQHWCSSPGVPLQGILAAELALAVPQVQLPLSSAFFTRGQFATALSARECEGLVFLADDLDRLLLPAQRPHYMADLAFLDELAAMIEVYLLPIWLIFTLSAPLGGAPGRLRHRYVHLHLQPSHRLGMV